MCIASGIRHEQSAGTKREGAGLTLPGPARTAIALSAHRRRPAARIENFFWTLDVGDGVTERPLKRREIEGLNEQWGPPYFVLLEELSDWSSVVMGRTRVAPRTSGTPWPHLPSRLEIGPN